MNILFLDAYFYPEITAFTHLENDIIKDLISEGHSIFVICPTPSRGLSKEIYCKYKKIKDEVFYDGKLVVKRFWAPREKKSVIKRFMRYIYCNLKTYNLAKKIKNIDMVFSNSTPPTQGFLASKIAKKKKCDFVFSVQDIFPDSLVYSGIASKKSFMYKIGKKILKKTYVNTTKIVVIDEYFKNSIKVIYDTNNIETISNWIDTDNVKPVDIKYNSLYDELKIPRNKFLVVYAGNMGESQNTNIILDIANEVYNSDKDILFVIFGGGSKFDEFKINASKYNNILVNPLLPQERVPEVYSLGDVAMITCKKGVGRSGLPSKTWSILACETPILACFDLDSPLGNLIVNNNLGEIVDPNDIESAVKKILYMKNNKKKYITREYVLKNASKEICCKKYCNLLTKK